MSDARDETPTSEPRSDDAFREPDNSTVDDWLGQRVQRDEETIDELVEETGGDEAEAERRFEQTSHEAEEYHEAHDQPTPEGNEKGRPGPD